MPDPRKAKEVVFFLTNFLVTLTVYGWTSFFYPSGAVTPRICLVWAAPITGTLVASLVTRKSRLGHALIAEALAIYVVSGFYCLVYHERAIVETMKWVSSAYFLPGATLAFLVGLVAKRILR